MAEIVSQGEIVVFIGSRVHNSPLVPGESYIVPIDGYGCPVHLDLVEVIQTTAAVDPESLKKYLSESKVKEVVVELAKQKSAEEVWEKSMAYLRGV